MDGHEGTNGMGLGLGHKVELNFKVQNKEYLNKNVPKSEKKKPGLLTYKTTGEVVTGVPLPERERSGNRSGTLIRV